MNSHSIDLYAVDRILDRVERGMTTMTDAAALRALLGRPSPCPNGAGHREGRALVGPSPRVVPSRCDPESYGAVASATGSDLRPESGHGDACAGRPESKEERSW